MVELPEEFVKAIKLRLGGDADKFFATYSLPAYRAIRVNTLKISVEDFVKISPFNLRQTAWEKRAFYIDEEKSGRHIFHAAGLYYSQEPSASSVAPKLEVKPYERALDLCSAPGGKGTQLAQDMQGAGVLVLNEINFSRAKILCANVERLGVKNAVVTCAPPDKLAEEFNGYFDKILVDAPCSGEGMFKKEPLAIPEWSVENVARCAERQARILDCADKMLACGGRLVYSTCTFSYAEDEGQIESFLLKHKNYTLKEMKLLLPHEIEGEGHFYAVLEKGGDSERSEHRILTPAADKESVKLYKQFERENLFVTFENLHSVGNILYSLPEDMPEIPLQTLRAGVRLGEINKGRFTPDHSLAMCLKINQAKYINVDESTAINYLKGLTFNCGQNSGWRLVACAGYPLGWCKAVDGTAKNHLPKGLRI